jgi:hypothetical protein
MKLNTNPDLQTRDLGIAIRDALEGESLIVFEEDAGDGIYESPYLRVAEIIDASDPNNLVVHLDNGQLFTIRIIAGAKP